MSDLRITGGDGIIVRQFQNRVAIGVDRKKLGIDDDGDDVASEIEEDAVENPLSYAGWLYTYSGVVASNGSSTTVVVDIDYIVDITAHHRSECQYLTGNIVTIYYDPRDGSWYVAENFGSLTATSDRDLDADSVAADTVTWEFGDNASGYAATFFRTKFDTSGNKLYQYSRVYEATNTGTDRKVSIETRSQLLPCGTYSTLTDLIPTYTSTTADSATWALATATDGVEVEVVTRVLKDDTDMKIYQFARTLKFDSLGMLRAITAETRTTIADTSTDCT